MPNETSKRITRDEEDRLVNFLPDVNLRYAAARSGEAPSPPQILIGSLALLVTNEI